MTIWRLIDWDEATLNLWEPWINVPLPPDMSLCFCGDTAEEHPLPAEHCTHQLCACTTFTLALPTS